jgi:hypothetical protein
MSLSEESRKQLSIILGGDPVLRHKWQRVLQLVGADATSSTAINIETMKEMCSAIEREDVNTALDKFALISEEQRIFVSLVRSIAQNLCALGTRISTLQNAGSNTGVVDGNRLDAIEKRLKKLEKAVKGTETNTQGGPNVSFNLTLTRNPAILTVRTRIYNQFMMTIGSNPVTKWRNVNANWRRHSREAKTAANITGTGAVWGNTRDPVAFPGETLNMSTSLADLADTFPGLADLQDDFVVNPEPVACVDHIREIVPKKMWFKIELATITGVTGAAFTGYGATWSDMLVSTFEAGTGGTVTINGETSPNYASLTDLSFNQDPGYRLNNQVFDYEAIKAAAQRRAQRVAVIFAVAGALLSAVGLDGYEELVGALADMVVAEPILADLYDMDLMTDLNADALLSQPYGPYEFDEFEFADEAGHYECVYSNVTSAGHSLMPDWGLTPNVSATPWGGTKDVATSAGDQDYQTGTYRVGTRNTDTVWQKVTYGSGTAPMGWFNYAGPDYWANQRGLPEFGVGFTEFDKTILKQKVTSGLSGGKLEYDFDLIVPYPQAWVEQGTASVPITGWNAIIVDGHVLAMYDAGWLDKQALFAVGT